MPTPPLSAAARRSLFVYNLFFPLALLVLLPGLLLRMFRRGGARENFGQRLGRYAPKIRETFAIGRWWWIHSISVGETGVALKLAYELQRRDPDLRLVISVTTSTGFAVAQRSISPQLQVIYNPLDTPGIVRAALEFIRPERLILIEGEAWPNLLAACHERGIPMALVNARLSPRSQRRMASARFWIAPIFDLIDRIFLPEESDLARWKMLGLTAAHFEVTGSIKFDTAGDPPLERQAEFRELLRAIGIPADAPIIVAGSTWEPEEKMLAGLLRELRPEFPTLVLILVPRHIERTAQIFRDLGPLGFRIVRRSEISTASAPVAPDILLVDTTGELREWYGLATLVIVGKSLPGVSETGGQNPAESAALEKATITGPHTENFHALMQLLEAHDAVRICDSISALREIATDLLHNPETRAALAQRARAALALHAGATQRTASRLLEDGRTR